MFSLSWDTQLFLTRGRISMWALIWADSTKKASSQADGTQDLEENLAIHWVQALCFPRKRNWDPIKKSIFPRTHHERWAYVIAVIFIELALCIIVTVCNPHNKSQKPIDALTFVFQVRVLSHWGWDYIISCICLESWFGVIFFLPYSIANKYPKIDLTITLRR